MKASVFNNPMLGEGLSELVRAYIGDPEQELRIQDAQTRNQINQLTLYEKAARLGMPIPGMEGMELGGLVASAARGGRVGGGGVSGAGAPAAATIGSAVTGPVTGGITPAPPRNYTLKPMNSTDLANIARMAERAGLSEQAFRARVIAMEGQYPSWSETAIAAATSMMPQGTGGEVPSDPDMPPLGSMFGGPAAVPTTGGGPALRPDSAVPGGFDGALGDMFTQPVQPPVITPKSMSAADIAAAEKLAAQAGVDARIFMEDVVRQTQAGIDATDAVANTYLRIQPGAPVEEPGMLGGLFGNTVTPGQPQLVPFVDPTRTPAANPNAAALQKARDAIAKGADRNKVIARLEAAGIDPSGL